MEYRSSSLYYWLLDTTIRDSCIHQTGRHSSLAGLMLVLSGVLHLLHMYLHYNVLVCTLIGNWVLPQFLLA